MSQAQEPPGKGRVEPGIEQDVRHVDSGERLLPKHPRGYYTEYTVPTPGSRDRGARRIVAGKGVTGNPATGGEYYYTDDHYRSSRRIRP